MSAIVLSFPTVAQRRRPAMPAVIDAAQRAELDLWIAGAAPYGWFLIESSPAATTPCYTIGHSAVDEEGIFQVCPDFDGWEVLSRRGQLLVYATLGDALASICPAATERAA